MMIDEAIVYLNNHGSLDNRNSQDMAVVQTIIDCIMWYREQDLIRREDVKNDEVLKEIALGFEREFLKTVMMIPKAEPKYSGCGYDIFCEKIDCKGCESEPKAEYRGNEDAD